MSNTRLECPVHGFGVCWPLPSGQVICSECGAAAVEIEYNPSDHADRYYHAHVHKCGHTAKLISINEGAAHNNEEHIHCDRMSDIKDIAVQLRYGYGVYITVEVFNMDAFAMQFGDDLIPEHSCIKEPANEQ